LTDASAAMWLIGVIIACIGGYVVVTVRQDQRRSRRRRMAETLGCRLIFGGLGFFAAGMIRSE
jgi:uncharacterized membrane protein YfcA